jgi:hypothetical protein
MPQDKDLFRCLTLGVKFSDGLAGGDRAGKGYPLPDVDGNDFETMPGKDALCFGYFGNSGIAGIQDKGGWFARGLNDIDTCGDLIPPDLVVNL